MTGYNNGRALAFWVDLDPMIAEDLWSVTMVRGFLNTCCERIKMRPISQPEINVVHDGVSGILQIATSHIAIHTCPMKHHALIEVFSCRDFDSAFCKRWAENFWSGTVITEFDIPLRRQLLGDSKDADRT